MGQNATFQQPRKVREQVVITLDPDKEYILQNNPVHSDGVAQHVKMLPHRDGNISVQAIRNDQEKPYFIKNLVVKTPEQKKAETLSQLRDFYPTAQREKEMRENNIPKPKKPQFDRNGIKKM